MIQKEQIRVIKGLLDHLDNKTNVKLNEFLDQFNSTEKKFLNKISFKNFINEFFSNYVG